MHHHPFNTQFLILFKSSFTSIAERLISWATEKINGVPSASNLTLEVNLSGNPLFCKKGIL